jgi:hypothetical protein
MKRFIKKGCCVVEKEIILLILFLLTLLVSIFTISEIKNLKNMKGFFQKAGCISSIIASFLFSYATGNVYLLLLYKYIKLTIK